MSTDDRISYLETGGEGVEDHDRLDLIRSALNRAETWAELPPGLFEDIVKAADEVGPAPERAGKRRVEPSIWIAAALAVVLVGIVLLLENGSSDDEARFVVAMTGTELAPEARGEARLSETPSGWYIRLELLGLPPAPQGSYYAGWLWRDGEGISIGTFHLRGGTDPVALWSGVSPEDFPVVRITLQDVAGGSEPSDRVMMAGAIIDD